MVRTLNFTFMPELSVWCSLGSPVRVYSGRLSKAFIPGYVWCTPIFYFLKRIWEFHEISFSRILSKAVCCLESIENLTFFLAFPRKNYSIR